MKLNKYQAAKAVGISRTTLDRHIKEGKLSAGKDGTGKIVIDLAELERVYRTVDSSGTSKTVSTGQSETSNGNQPVQPELEIWRDYLDRLEGDRNRERQQMESVIEDLRKDRDHWRQQATALLTDRREKEEKPSIARKGFRVRLAQWIAGTE